MKYTLLMSLTSVPVRKLYTGSDPVALVDQAQDDLSLQCNFDPSDYGFPNLYERAHELAKLDPSELVALDHNELPKVELHSFDLDLGNQEYPDLFMWLWSA